MEAYLLHCSWFLHLAILAYHFIVTRFISFEIMDIGSNSHVGKPSKVTLIEYMSNLPFSHKFRSPK